MVCNESPGFKAMPYSLARLSKRDLIPYPAITELARIKRKRVRKREKITLETWLWEKPRRSKFFACSLA